MAKKTVTEVVEIEAGAVLAALRSEGYPISSVENVSVLDDQGAVVGMRAFGGLRFTYTHEERIQVVKAGT